MTTLSSSAPVVTLMAPVTSKSALLMFTVLLPAPRFAVKVPSLMRWLLMPTVSLPVVPVTEMDGVSSEMPEVVNVLPPAPKFATMPPFTATVPPLETPAPSVPAREVNATFPPTNRFAPAPMVLVVLPAPLFTVTFPPMLRFVEPVRLVIVVPAWSRFCTSTLPAMFALPALREKTLLPAPSSAVTELPSAATPDALRDMLSTPLPPLNVTAPRTSIEIAPMPTPLSPSPRSTESAPPTLKMVPPTLTPSLPSPPMKVNPPLVVTLFTPTVSFPPSPSIVMLPALTRFSPTESEPPPSFMPSVFSGPCTSAVIAAAAPLKAMVVPPAPLIITVSCPM